MQDRQDVRASDLERQKAADRLRRAVDDGRLTLHEYDSRLGSAYQARTHGELQALFDDLPLAGSVSTSAGPPAAAVSAPTAPTARPARSGMPTALRVLWAIWGAVMAINVVVWVLVGLGNGGLEYFWPMWLLVPGAVIFAVTVAVGAGRCRG